VVVAKPPGIPALLTLQEILVHALGYKLNKNQAAAGSLAANPIANRQFPCSLHPAGYFGSPIRQLGILECPGGQCW